LDLWAAGDEITDLRNQGGNDQKAQPDDGQHQGEEDEREGKAPLDAALLESIDDGAGVSVLSSPPPLPHELGCALDRIIQTVAPDNLLYS
jgi:hypothetical protein